MERVDPGQEWQRLHEELVKLQSVAQRHLTPEQLLTLDYDLEWTVEKLDAIKVYVGECLMANEVDAEVVFKKAGIPLGYFE